MKSPPVTISTRCREVLTLEQTQANALQATALNVREGTLIFHSVMVHYENDLPVQIKDRCVNMPALYRIIWRRITARPRLMHTCR